MVYIKSNFKCSKTLPRNAGELTGKTKIRSKNCREVSSSPNNSIYRLNVRFESLSSANYRAELNNGFHEISPQFCCQKALLLHNTVYVDGEFN